MTTKATRKRLRRLSAWLIPILFISSGASWILIDSFRARAKQASQYALPNDRRAESMLKFMRELDAKYDPRATLVKSSNLPAIHVAMRDAAKAIDEDRSALSAAELRESDYYPLHFGLMAKMRGDRADDAELNELLARTKRFIDQSSEVASKEANVASYAVFTLDVCGRTEDALQTADFIEAKFSSLPDSRQKASVLTTLAGTRTRLQMLGSELDWNTRTLDGKLLDSTRLRGKVVLVEFWSPTCGPCISDFPALKRIYRTHHDDGFEVLAVCLYASAAKIRLVTKKHELPWMHVCHDEIEGNTQWAEQFAIAAVPTTMLVDQTGRVVSFGVRPLHDDPRLDLESCLNRMLE